LDGHHSPYARPSALASIGVRHRTHRAGTRPGKRPLPRRLRARPPGRRRDGSPPFWLPALRLAPGLLDPRGPDPAARSGSPGPFGLGLALQGKTSTFLHLPERSVHPLLKVHFSVQAERLIAHPLFWYLFAYLDTEKMCLGDPLFLVPSAFVHSHGLARQEAGR